MMTTQTAALEQTTTSRKPTSRPLLLGLAIASFAALLLELSLTRLFSVVLFYHFAFLAISIALLGLGSGGVFAHLAKGGVRRFRTHQLLSALSVLNAIVIPIVLGIVLHTRVSLVFSRGNFFRLTLLYLVSAMPFFLTGLGFSVVFARETKAIPRLYGADLLGAALACLGVVPLLNWLGGPNTVLFAGVMAAVAGAVWADEALMRRIAGGLASFLLVVIAANHSGQLLDIVYAKGIFRDKSVVEFVRWNAISRVEVSRNDEGRGILIDQDAATAIMNVDPKLLRGSPLEKRLLSVPAALVNVLRPYGQYAIIGPGGGVDVLRALAGGASHVTGIEINPIIANDIMRGRYAQYSQNLYERSDVDIHVTDGRFFVRNAKQSFDVVQMTLVDTWASTAAGAFALSENSLYTVQAFREYFEHLKPDGMIAITRWEFREPREALRVVSVAMEALHDLGVVDPTRNFIVVSKGALTEDGIPVLVMAKRSPFSSEEEQKVRQHVQDSASLVALYLPSEPGNSPFSSLISSKNAYAFASDYAYNVNPVSDNAPFFFFTLKLRQVIPALASGRGIDWKVNLGVAVLATVLAISLLGVIAFLLTPLILSATPERASPATLLYFVMVGLAYILVEISLIQRFVLFLGHPTYALTVVMFLLLLASGCGSLASCKWLPDTKQAWFPILLIVGILISYVLVLPKLLNAAIGLAFVTKLVVSAVLLVPLGFVMGMPFPTGLRALAVFRMGNFPTVYETGRENAVEWAWAMNAGASVLGSVLAIVIAIQFGLNATLACGAAAYTISIPLLRTLHWRELAPKRDFVLQGAELQHTQSKGFSEDR